MTVFNLLAYGLLAHGSPRCPRARDLAAGAGGRRDLATCGRAAKLGRVGVKEEAFDSHAFDSHKTQDPQHRTSSQLHHTLSVPSTHNSASPRSRIQHPAMDHLDIAFEALGCHTYLQDDALDAAFLQPQPYRANEPDDASLHSVDAAFELFRPQQRSSGAALAAEFAPTDDKDENLRSFVNHAVALAKLRSGPNRFGRSLSYRGSGQTACAPAQENKICSSTFPGVARGASRPRFRVLKTNSGAVCV